MSARPALWGEGLGNDPSYPARFEAAWSEIITALEPPECTFQNRNNVAIAELLH